MEQNPLISKSSIPTQSPSPIIQSQWQQLPHPQQNPTTNLAQHGQPPQFVQPTAPFWLPQRPVYPLSAVNAPTTFQPLTSVGTTDSGWQAPVAVGGGTSSTNQPQTSNFCYHVGYTYPAFPGKCAILVISMPYIVMHYVELLLTSQIISDCLIWVHYNFII